MSELKRSQARPDDSDGGKRQDLTLASALDLTLASALTPGPASARQAHAATAPREPEKVKFPTAIYVKLIAVTVIFFCPWPFILEDWHLRQYPFLQWLVDVMGSVAPIVDRFAVYRFPGATAMRIHFAICWFLVIPYIFVCYWIHRKVNIASLGLKVGDPVPKRPLGDDIVAVILLFAIVAPLNWYGPQWGIWYQYDGQYYLHPTKEILKFRNPFTRSFLTGSGFLLIGVCAVGLLQPRLRYRHLAIAKQYA
jgi:hypothetical protein